MYLIYSSFPAFCFLLLDFPNHFHFQGWSSTLNLSSYTLYLPRWVRWCLASWRRTHLQLRVKHPSFRVLFCSPTCLFDHTLSSPHYFVICSSFISVCLGGESVCFFPKQSSPTCLILCFHAVSHLSIFFSSPHYTPLYFIIMYNIFPSGSIFLPWFFYSEFNHNNHFFINICYFPKFCQFHTIFLQI